MHGTGIELKTLKVRREVNLQSTWRSIDLKRLRVGSRMASQQTLRLTKAAGKTRPSGLSPRGRGRPAAFIQHIIFWVGSELVRKLSTGLKSG